MSTTMTAILALSLAASFAAALVFAAKWEEARQKIWDERIVWLTEIKKIEHDKEILLEGGRKDAETIMWYADQLADCEWRRRRANNKNRDLQDKLSVILCPTQNHVWVDGVCTKCGRMQDA